MQALNVIRDQDLAEWGKLRGLLKANKVSLRDLDKAMKQAKSQGEAGNGGDDAEQLGRAHPYCVHDGILHLMKRGRDGDYLVSLCNFNAWMVGEKVYDDGAVQIAVFVIQGARQTGQPLSTVEVPASQFAPMGWVAKNWGAQAILNAGQSVKDHVRAAIQGMSGEVPREGLCAPQLEKDKRGVGLSPRWRWGWQGRFSPRDFGQPWRQPLERVCTAGASHR